MSILDKFDDLANASDDSIKIVLIEKFLKENYRIIGYYAINNGIVDVIGSVIVKNKKITELTNGVFEFGTIHNYFDCSYCDSLTSLKGAPKEVGGSFRCSFCEKLTSLEGAPEEVHGWFGCKNCGGRFTKEQVAAASKVKYIAV